MVPPRLFEAKWLPVQTFFFIWELNYSTFVDKPLITHRKNTNTPERLYGSDMFDVSEQTPTPTLQAISHPSLRIRYHNLSAYPSLSNHPDGKYRSELFLNPARKVFRCRCLSRYGSSSKMLLWPEDFAVQNLDSRNLTEHTMYLIGTSCEKMSRTFVSQDL